MVRNRCIFLFVGMCLLGIPPVKGQTNWTKYDNTIPTNSDTTTTNGRIAVGVSGGDTANVHHFAMIKDDNLYKIWYAGDAVSYVSRGYYATSPDGLTWTKYDNTIPTNSDTTNTNGRLGLGTAGRGDDGRVRPGTVIKDGVNSYKMWYTGYDEAVYRIFYATSTDGVAWVKYDNTIPAVSDGVCTNGKIAPGNSGRGDYVGTFHPMVIKDGGVYKMWYTGLGTNAADFDYRIYYATSSDGLTWTKYDNTVPTNSDGTSTNGRLGLGTAGKGDAVGVFSPQVIKDGATYHMWYSAFGGPNKIYYATSPDGLTWTKYNNNNPANSDTTSTDGRIPLGASGGDVQHAYAPRVVRVGLTYKMWYTGSASSIYRLYHATSPAPPPPAGTVIRVY